jgi:hypothetical protein
MTKLNQHPIVVLLGIVASILAIFGFITGINSINTLITGSENGPTNTLDCSQTIEIGPWLSLSEVTFNPNRDGWVQADFWSASGQIIEGYDEISVIFDPSLRVTVSNVQGIAWHYDKSVWNQEDVEQCTQKHVDDSWNIRHKRLIIITPAELCSILPCR